MAVFCRQISFEHPIIKTHHYGVTRARYVETDPGPLRNHMDVTGNESSKLFSAGTVHLQGRRTGQLHGYAVDINLALTDESHVASAAFESDAVDLQRADLGSKHNHTPDFRPTDPVLRWWDTRAP